ncbi:hypothetical protein C483_16583 [Natrialba hulunbeirensis JCM 10989]|uniref:Uncharacterized protein n=1 Tax=Natrialba hulunbeirensis JCM 10989 TaxID=1227493 RepID=L9ZMG8_9EURY|nr:hypothetical protein [Natrialba hulunbeirensis]ELY87534.1 hypothetical protein C483_16583 [Natrialba hulunbeirensis JCM 10989]
MTVRWSILLLLGISLALVGVGLSDSAYAPPYEDPSEYPHYIAPESTATFETHVDDADRDEPIPVDEFSPLAQEFIERTLEEGTNSGATQGEVPYWEPNVCTDVVIYCADGYEAPPSAFEYHDTENGTVLVEDGDEAFLLLTYDASQDSGTPWHFDDWFEGFVPTLTLFLPALGLGAFAVRTHPSTRTTVRVSGFGIGLLLLALGTPYFVMAGVSRAVLILVGIIGSVGFLLFLGQLVRRSVDSNPTDG